MGAALWHAQASVPAAWPQPACQCVCLLLWPLLTLQIMPASVIHIGSHQWLPLDWFLLSLLIHPGNVGNVSRLVSFATVHANYSTKWIIKSTERYLKNDCKYNVKTATASNRDTEQCLFCMFIIYSCSRFLKQLWTIGFTAVFPVAAYTDIMQSQWSCQPPFNPSCSQSLPVHIRVVYMSLYQSFASWM